MTVQKGVLSFFFMLTHLRITNFALLEDVSIDLDSGLSFLTGETGAGKSILIDAICRLLGSRATQDDVRTGEPKATIEGVFDRISGTASELLREWEIDSEESGLIVRREIHASGRSRMLLNNCSVTLQQLRKLAPHLIDLFGQNEHQTLLDSDSQRNLFDETIGIQNSVIQLNGIAAEIHALQTEWKSLRQQEQQRQRDIDIWKYQIQEIENANPSISEESDLQTKRTLLHNRERLHSLCESLIQLIVEKDGSLLSEFKEVERGVSELAKYQNEFASFSNRIAEWQEGCQELLHSIGSLQRSLDFDEGSLDEIETRLEILQTLKKKYGPSLQDVLDHLERSKTQLAMNLNVEEREQQLLSQVHQAVVRYEALAGEISNRRSQGTAGFAASVEEELRQIAMEKCRFRVELRPQGRSDQSEMEKEYPSTGYESVYFEIEPNVGEGFRELSKIASGGELSRFMLALKVVSQRKNEEHTFIFDEIDAGIGGRVAYRVGERLKRLSRSAQVLCVTHLPQVAAFGDHHYQVQKMMRANRTITIVNSLDELRRVEELARMISGSEVTETALRHARELREQVEAGVS